MRRAGRCCSAREAPSDADGRFDAADTAYAAARRVVDLDADGQVDPDEVVVDHGEQSRAPVPSSTATDPFGNVRDLGSVLRATVTRRAAGVTLAPVD